MNSADLCDLRGAKCRIFGLGKSNEALISYLARHGAEIIVSDKRKSENEITDVLQKNGIKNAKILPYSRAEKGDFVFRTPSIRPDSKEITDNLTLGARLTSEVELFFARAKGQIYGITGSDGKTTTTTLTYEMLKQENPLCTYVGGNIGTPLVSFLDALNDNSITVCELSSFQLMTLNHSPDYAAITNLTENHLDFHRNLLEYAASKSKIYSSDRCKKLVISKNCSHIFSDISPLPVNTITFSPDFGGNIGINNGYITYFGSPILSVSDIKLKGAFNVLNYMTAIGLSFPFVSHESIINVAKSFNGVEHRLELVREINGVKYYNCSIDSTPSRTCATLNCFKGEDNVLILGGYDKGLDYTPLAKATGNVRKIVLVGANKWKIYNSLITHCYPLENISVCSDFSAAVHTAVSLSKGGDNVLLSPASASFDLFENFEKRGECFKNIINNI